MGKPKIKVHYGICDMCKFKKEIHAKGMCFNCYRKKSWEPKIIICIGCGKKKFHHAFNLCINCYHKNLKYDGIKQHQIRKYHNISLEVWKEITKRCIICGFDKVVHLHHLDENHDNTSRINLVGLCPNHHKMIHMDKFKEEIEQQIKKKFIDVTYN